MTEPTGQPLGELAQLFTNLAYLCTHDLTTERQETTMAEQKLNDVIDDMKATEDQLAAALPALVADDKMQKDRADALEAAAEALDANGDVIDAQHAETLRGLAAGLNPLLTLLTPAAAPVDTTPSPAQTTDPTPAPTDTASTPAVTTAPAPNDVQ